MRIQLLSDLHFEFHRDGGRAFVDALDPADIDVLVVAGDLVPARHLPDALLLLCEHYPDVVFVPGNHEYYGSSPGEVAAARRHSRADNLHWLDGDVLVLDGVRFVGATLWFDDLGGRKNFMNDFRMIRNFEPWVYEKFRDARDFLQGNVRRGDVVVTHYLPSHKSVAKQYEGDPLNCFFVSDVESIIVEKQPRLWLHGHTHASCDYQIGETRVVCNPYGYQSAMQVNADFVQKLVLEVPRG